MSWAPRVFWTEASVEAVDGGFTVRLDGRAVKTPSKAEFVLPSRGLAEAAATEWQAQNETVDPSTMPATRFANSAIDKVTPQFSEVAAMLAGYGETDLICYRADRPESLVARQQAAWDPLIAWAEATYGAQLTLIEGLMPQPQSAEACARLGAPLRAMTPFELAAMHDLISLSGSLVIGLAVAEGHGSADSLWAASRIDEDWQAEQWGPDEEAQAHAELKRAAFVNAERFLALARGA